MSWEFFYHNAGRSYHPGRESEIVGAALGAVELARAELWAAEQGAQFEWLPDPEGADVQDESGDWEHLPAMSCCMYLLNESGEWVLSASLHAITESDDYTEKLNYRRVVQAELAAEVMP